MCFKGSWICGKWWASKPLNLSQTATAFKQYVLSGAAEVNPAENDKNNCQENLIHRSHNTWGVPDTWMLLICIDMPDMSDMCPSHWPCCAPSQWWDFLSQALSSMLSSCQMKDMKTACRIQFQAIPCTISRSKQVSQSTENLSADFWIFGLIFATFLDHRCFMLFHCINPFRCQPTLFCWYISKSQLSPKSKNPTLQH